MSQANQTPLRLWRDIDPLSRPMKKSPGAYHVLVIGGGVTALVTAWVLLDHGYQVTIMAKSWAGDTERLTSQIAGALWEFPPAVCGKHSEGATLDRFKKWSMVGYPIFQGLAADPNVSKAFGVKMMPSTFFFRSTIEQIPDEQEKMLEIMAIGVRGFRRSPKIISEQGIELAAGIVDAYEHLAPVVDTDKAILFIMELVKSKGARLVTETVEDDLINIEDSLIERFSAHVVVNATGLGSKVVAGDDTVFPIRGALLRVVNDGVKFPKIQHALTAPSPDGNVNEFIFLVPRNDDVLIMGGFSGTRQWNLDLTLESPQIIRMREMCEAFMPALKNARLVKEYPLAQGLRPFRDADARVEREHRREGSRIIHSYAQGGSGWSWSFGCAQDVLGMVHEIVSCDQVVMDIVHGVISEKDTKSGCGPKVSVAPLIMFGDAW